MPAKIIIPKEQELEIVDQYENKHLSAIKIAKIHKLEQTWILKLLSRNGVKIRPHVQKSWLNENYFQIIDSERKAYFLGYLLADGCVCERPKSSKRLSMSLQLRDGYILEFLREDLESDKQILYSEIRNNAVLDVSSNKLCNDLIKLGITPRKSFTAKFPTFDQVPEHLFHHFMRGLFDGDGCICSQSRRDTRNTTFHFEIFGTFDVCNGVARVLDNLVVSNDIKQAIKKENIYFIGYYKLQSLKQIYNYLYQDATIWLDRKRIKFKEVFSISPKRRPNYTNDTIIAC